MLGQPSSMLIPQVVGFKLTGKLPEGATATDLVLTVTQMLRKHGVVGKFVEFFGDGLQHLALADRATIAQHGARIRRDLRHLPDRCRSAQLPAPHRPRREADRAGRGVREGAGPVARRRRRRMPSTSSTLELDLGDVRPSLAGPKRPQDRVLLEDVRKSYRDAISVLTANRKPKTATIERFAQRRRRHGGRPRRERVRRGQHVEIDGQDFELSDGAVVIAAITCCTNTSNPAVMIGAGLLARKAVEKGLKAQAVGEDLARAGLAGRHRLPRDAPACSPISTSSASTSSATAARPASATRARCPTRSARRIARRRSRRSASVLSGNRNFEGRVHPEVKMNYLASPPLVVAYALAGTVDIDLTKEPLGIGNDGKPVYLKDIWPTQQGNRRPDRRRRSARSCSRRATPTCSRATARWNSIPSPEGEIYEWDAVDLHQESAVLRRHDDAAGAGRRHPRRALPRPLRRFDHDRSHLAGRQHQEGFARRAVT